MPDSFYTFLKTLMHLYGFFSLGSGSKYPDVFTSMRTLPFLIVLIYSAALLTAACGSAEEQINRRAAAAQAAGASSSPDGMAIFRQYCVVCHGADGKLGLNGAKDLSASILTPEERINIITNGRKLMTPFNEILSADEIKAVAEYTQTLKK
ncbi:MAG: cytochrome c [Lewinellaceae bacterium]|nr:cytochrome c [Lewinellaceae bacterium]